MIIRDRKNTARRSNPVAKRQKVTKGKSTAKKPKLPYIDDETVAAVGELVEQPRINERAYWLSDNPEALRWAVFFEQADKTRSIRRESTQPSAQVRRSRTKQTDRASSRRTPSRTLGAGFHQIRRHGH
jgi:hypothetical protein